MLPVAPAPAQQQPNQNQATLQQGQPQQTAPQLEEAAPLNGPNGVQEDTGSQHTGQQGPGEQHIEQVVEIRSILKPSRPDGELNRGQAGKVMSWTDFHGRELTTVFEFEGSESEPSEDEDIDGGEKGCCLVS
mmetsp:Transcript_2350/g.3903  ORF Transcript_2350/g.3903 Transcript_2350/m.3903 type:complete len:132 (+) Transcript_2350:99-494(+)